MVNGGVCCVWARFAYVVFGHFNGGLRERIWATKTNNDEWGAHGSLEILS